MNKRGLFSAALALAMSSSVSAQQLNKEEMKQAFERLELNRTWSEKCDDPKGSRWSYVIDQEFGPLNISDFGGYSARSITSFRLITGSRFNIEERALDRNPPGPPWVKTYAATPFNQTWERVPNGLQLIDAFGPMVDGNTHAVSIVQFTRDRQQVMGGNQRVPPAQQCSPNALTLPAAYREKIRGQAPASPTQSVSASSTADLGEPIRIVKFTPASAQLIWSGKLVDDVTISAVTIDCWAAAGGAFPPSAYEAVVTVLENQSQKFVNDSRVVAMAQWTIRQWQAWCPKAQTRNWIPTGRLIPLTRITIKAQLSGGAADFLADYSITSGQVSVRNQVRAREPQRLAAVAERNAKTAKREQFATSAGIKQWVDASQLIANPFVFKNQVVGVAAKFQNMIAEDKGIFAAGSHALVVSKLPATKFRGNEEVVLGVEVRGTENVKINGVELTLPLLYFANSTPCLVNGCQDYFD